MAEDERQHGEAPKQSYSVAEVKAIIASLQTVEPNFRLLTRTQAAEYVRAIGKKSCTPKSLANLASEGKGPPYITLGNETFYLPSDLRHGSWERELIRGHASWPALNELNRVLGSSNTYATSSKHDAEATNENQCAFFRLPSIGARDEAASKPKLSRHFHAYPRELHQRPLLARAIS